MNVERSAVSHRGELQPFPFSDAAAPLPAEFTRNAVDQAGLETSGLCPTKKRLSKLSWLNVVFYSANKCGKICQKPG